MDEFVIKAKHYQIVISFLIPTIIAGAIPSANETIYLIKSIFVFLPSVVWIFVLGKSLNRCVPGRYRLNETGQTVSIFIFVIAYVTLVMFTAGMIYFTGLAAFIPLFIIGCYLYLFYFAAKALVTAEKGKPASFGEFFGEMILFIFSILGVWVFQPRANKLWKANQDKY
ncbi:hypothetical protein [Marinoscillum sp.]|uniref:hypothetical protein n=1 Tax=Marinoscillum sp. TaxID=2024838 RepID=UPI003BAA300B